MNNDFESDYTKSLEKVSLTETEKRAMRRALEIHIGHKGNRPIVSPFAKFTFLIPLTAVFFLIFGTLGAVSDRALPGEPLYALKHVNEDMQELFALNDRKVTEVKLNRAIRRLEEAEELTLAGKMNPAVKEELEKSFSSVSADTLAHIKALEEEGGDDHTEVSAKFVGSLNAHRNILSDVYENTSSQSARLAEGNTIRMEVESVILELQDPSDLAIAATSQSMMVATKVAPTEIHSIDERTTGTRGISSIEAEQLATIADEKIKSVSETLADDKKGIALRARQTLSVAEELLRQGKDAFDDGEYEKAANLYKRASRKAIEAAAEAASYLRANTSFRYEKKLKK